MMYLHIFHNTIIYYSNEINEYHIREVLNGERLIIDVQNKRFLVGEDVWQKIPEL